MRELRRGLRVFGPAVVLALTIAALMLHGVAIGQQNVPDILGPGETAPQPGTDGTDGRSDSGSTSGSDAGPPGRDGVGQKGQSTRQQGATPAPAPSPSGVSPSKATTKSSTSASSASSFTGTFSGGIPVIFLEENDLYTDAFTVPSPAPLETLAPSEAPVKQPAAQTQAKPATKSEGFPLRRTIGILAALVALGSAASLISQGRAGRRRGRRSFSSRS
ncbi:MAG: hypothetical protein ACR2FO_05590 [Actinomycetota bacterium]